MADIPGELAFFQSANPCDDQDLFCPLRGEDIPVAGRKEKQPNNFGAVELKPTRVSLVIMDLMIELLRN